MLFRLFAGVLAGCILFITVAQAQTAVPPRDDHQFWHETQIVKPLDEAKTKNLVFIGILRTGRELHRPVDERIGAGVSLRFKKYFTFMPFYLYTDQQPFAGRHINEHRLVAELTIKVPVGKFTFTDRNRYERRVRHRERDFGVYRNRLFIDHPAKLGSFAFKPFIGAEIFYSTQTTGGRPQDLVRVRYLAGINKQITSQLYGEVFYVRQQDGVARPGNVHAVGTFLRYTLK
ncbi:MAG: DUF2490 domain-containing protein [Acidobacteria bacterium]|nr:DUF2490 domain-containing protein [Acidobacteriota bacterium]